MELEGKRDELEVKIIMPLLNISINSPFVKYNIFGTVYICAVITLFQGGVIVQVANGNA